MSPYPALLCQWEPQLGLTVYIAANQHPVAVKLERDSVTQLPIQWRAVRGDEVFPCTEYRLWAPTLDSWL